MNHLDPAKNIASDYLSGAFMDLGAKVREAVRELSLESECFEGIVVRGTSGLLVGPMVASELKKPWCIVRKSGDGSHSTHKMVEGWFGFKTYIIIDDLIATGGTVRSIQESMNAHAAMRNTEIKCVGYYLYNSNKLVWRGKAPYAYQEKYFISPAHLRSACNKAILAKQIAEAAGYRQATFEGAIAPMLPGVPVSVTKE